jgi:LacI family transcriptional regulator
VHPVAVEVKMTFPDPDSTPILPPDPSLTMRDVAKALGISHSTVSRALRNHPQIPESHRLEIQAAAEKMGYRLNAAAAALSHQRNKSGNQPATTGVIAWLNLWPEAKKLRSYKEFDRYWLGAFAAAEKFGYRLEEFVCGGEMTRQHLAKILLARGITSILIPPCFGMPLALNDFPWKQFSAIRFGRSLVSPELHVVGADPVANTLMAYEKIQSRGYKRIGWVNWNRTEDLGRIFKAGFLLAESRMEERFRVSCLSLTPGNRDEVRKVFHRWLKNEKPEALFTEMAEIPAMLQECGYRVPEDIGLAVNSVLDGKADAGVDQNSFEIGRVAMLTLLSLMHDNDRGVPSIHWELLIMGNWVDGASLPPR